MEGRALIRSTAGRVPYLLDLTRSLLLSIRESSAGLRRSSSTAGEQGASSPSGQATPKELGFGTQSLTIFIQDIELHYAKAKSTGVTIVGDLHETVYGELQYAAKDLDSHHWLFSRQVGYLSVESKT